MTNSGDTLAVEHYANIGRISVESTALDAMVHDLVRNLADDVELCDILAAQMTTDLKLTKAALLVRSRLSGELRDDLLQWLRHVKTVQDKRGEVAHSLWRASKHDQTIIGSRLRTKGGDDQEVLHHRSLDVRHLAPLVDEMRGVRLEGQKFDDVAARRAAIRNI